MAQGVLKLRNLVGGAWVGSPSGRVALVLNPATDRVDRRPPSADLGDALDRQEAVRVRRDMSKYALEDYSQVKHVMAKLG